jgi:hypothetical protein
MIDFNQAGPPAVAIGDAYRLPLLQQACAV